MILIGNFVGFAVVAEPVESIVELVATAAELVGSVVVEQHLPELELVVIVVGLVAIADELAVIAADWHLLELVVRLAVLVGPLAKLVALPAGGFGVAA
jgi:hypothetical protein